MRHTLWIAAGLLAACATNHQAIIEFQGKWYFFYHPAALPGGGEYRRSVSVERMYYHPDGTIRPITRATEGLNLQPPRSKEP